MNLFFLKGFIFHVDGWTEAGGGYTAPCFQAQCGTE